MCRKQGRTPLGVSASVEGDVLIIQILAFLLERHIHISNLGGSWVLSSSLLSNQQKECCLGFFHFEPSLSLPTDRRHWSKPQQFAIWVLSRRSLQYLRITAKRDKVIFRCNRSDDCFGAVPLPVKTGLA